MAKEKICGIYCIENLVNGKKYIGQSINIKSRFRGHKSELKRKIHKNEHLQKSWNKYGEINFKFNIVEICDEFLLDKKEKYYIELYNSYTHDNGYNIEFGGKEKGKIPNSTKNKISENHANVSGVNNPFYKKHHSKETIDKIIHSNGYLNRRVYGELNYKAQLTENEVVEIKKYFKDNIFKRGDITLLAKKYNVSTGIISHIRNNYSWKNVQL